MSHRTKQQAEYFMCSVSKLVIFMILATDSSRAAVNQVNAVGESEPSLFFYQDRGYPKDCKEVQEQCSARNTTGARLILPHGYHEPFWVFCSGEWTVVQRHFDRFIDFNRSWADYRDGFGFPGVDHWLGNEKLSYLTNQKVYELRIELQTDSGEKGFISYDAFRINDEFGVYNIVSLGRRALDGGTPRIHCPTNMVYGNCSRCIATCADPSGTVDCSNDCTDFPQTCVCPPNYLMDGPNCLPEEQCGCHLHGYGVVADSITHVMANCSECTCNSGVLTCDTSPCAREATCKVVDGARGCVCDEGYEGDGRTCRPTIREIQRDCSELPAGSASGDYTTSSGWIMNCNMTIDGGGWTVIQRHFLSSSRVDFRQNWAAYKNGFGSPSGEFWIGNDELFTLTNQGEYEIRIDMVQYNTHRQFYAKYDFFRIKGESDKYQLSELGSFTGTPGITDSYSMRHNHNRFFSTIDRDNDNWSYNCADHYNYGAGGGWWYGYCSHFYPNFGNARSSNVGYWYHLPGSNYLIHTEIKIRPRRAKK